MNRQRKTAARFQPEMKVLLGGLTMDQGWVNGLGTYLFCLQGPDVRFELLLFANKEKEKSVGTER